MHQVARSGYGAPGFEGLEDSVRPRKSPRPDLPVVSLGCLTRQAHARREGDLARSFCRLLGALRSSLSTGPRSLES